MTPRDQELLAARDHLRWLEDAFADSVDRAEASSHTVGDPALVDEVAALARASREFPDVALPSLVAVKPHRSPLSLGPGTVIDDLTVDREIGKGGMGRVYRALQRDPPRQVAVKVLSPAYLSHADERRFRREVELLARLQHPAIVSIIGTGRLSGELGGAPYYSMELIEGEPVTSFVDARSLDDSARVALVVEICGAVEHAHQRGVIHRDLKPGNVLVDRDGRPHVLDFGIAQLVQDASSEHTQTLGVGTVAYMAPELFDDTSASLDTRSDVYSLGVLTFQLLTGKLPIAVNSHQPLAAIQAIRVARPPRLEDCNRRFKGDLSLVVSRALAKDPALRYQSVRELREDLERYLKGLPVSARRASAAYVVSRWISRNRLAATACVLVALSLVAGATATIIQLRRAQAAELVANRRLLELRRTATEFVTDLTARINTFQSTAEVKSFLASEAINRLEPLLADSGGDPRALWELSTAYLRLGVAKGHIGEPNEGRPDIAQRFLERACDLRDRVLASEPASFEYTLGTADIYSKLATLLTDRPKAARHMASSVELLARAAQMPDATDDTRLKFAYTLAVDGTLRASAGEDFKNAYRAAEEECEQVLAGDPDSVEARSVLGTILNMYATSLGQIDDPDAIPLVERARSVLVPLLALKPDEYSLVRHVARASRVLALYHATRGDLERGIREADAVLVTLRQWHAKDPTNSTYRLDLANAVLCASDIRSRAGAEHRPGARVLAEEVVTLMLMGRSESELTDAERNRWTAARELLANLDAQAAAQP